MKYATWNLFYEGEEDGWSGPEGLLSENGSRAQAALSQGFETENIKILGYFWGEPPLQLLSRWNWQEVSKEQAVLFASEVGSDIYIDSEGFFVNPNDSYMEP